MLGFRDRAVLDLEPQAELNRLARLLHHADKPDLPGDGIGHVQREHGRYGAGRGPQSFAGLFALCVLDELQVGAELDVARVVGDERGEVIVRGLDEARAVASARRLEQPRLRERVAGDARRNDSAGQPRNETVVHGNPPSTRKETLHECVAAGPSRAHSRDEDAVRLVPNLGRLLGGFMGIRALVHQFLAGLLALCAASLAGAQPPAALTGRVTSTTEGAMEGVLVSLKREGSNKTVTVVSHADGTYAFPRDRLEPGRYAVSTRAVKYMLAERGAQVEIAAAAPAKLDLTLRDSNPLELALQLTDPEWFASYPLDDRTKWELFRDCSRCHTMRRPSMSTYDAEELAWVMMRMVYSAGSSPMRFQLPANATPHWGRTEGGEPSGLQRRQAEAVASINLHNGTWNYELKTMPRPKGKETDVVYTTWDLPATARPHDTRIAADGTIWFNHFNDNAIGRLDPKTGEVKEWHWPYRAKEGSFQPTGARTLMGPDAERPLVHRQSGAKRRRRVRPEDRAIRVSRSTGRRRDDRRLRR